MRILKAKHHGHDQSRPVSVKDTHVRCRPVLYGMPFVEMDFRILVAMLIKKNPYAVGRMDDRTCGPLLRVIMI